MGEISVIQYRGYKDFRYGTLDILFQNQKEIIISGTLKKKGTRCKWIKIRHGGH